MFKDLYLWLLVVAVVLFSIQALGLVIYIYSFIPLVWDDSFLKGLEPTRCPLFYFVFLGTNVVLMAISVKWVLPKLNTEEAQHRFKLWLGLESFWCFLVLFCFFKWTTYRYPFWNILPYENQGWLQPFFCVVCGLAVLSKAFFPEVYNFYGLCRIMAGKRTFPAWFAIALQAAFVGAVIALLYIPKPADVVALALAWDQWNHLDRVTGWFIQQGWFVSYEQTIGMLIIAAIMYIVAVFYFIRLWLGSWLLAAAGAVLVTKLGLFYYSIAPCVWINPSNTFLAHGWDIILFFALWWVSTRRPEQFLATAMLSGFALVAAWIFSGGYLSALGLDNQPMMAPLRVRQFFPFFMGYVLPVFYVFTLLAVRDRFVRVLCIYGLMIFVDYIEHPAIGFYGSLMVPAILVMLWWFKQISGTWVLSLQRAACAGMLLFSAGALLTNRLLLTYPNIFFQDLKRFEKEQAMYAQFDAPAKSAPLIQRLVPENQKVVCLSNFEVALLMHAHRRSVFENAPVMFSKLSDTLGGLNLRTKKQMDALIDRIRDENALYVFVDTRLWTLPSQALGNSGLAEVMGYVRDHYQEFTSQGFLTALQRKTQ